MDKSHLLTGFSHIFTGLVGDIGFLHELSDVIDKVKRKNPGVKYVCDPVLGDRGVFYVNENVVKPYIEKIIPKTYMITPN